MRRISNLFKAFFNLGRVGLILAFLALMLTGVAIFQQNNAFDDAVKLLTSVTILEDNVQGELNSIRTSESTIRFNQFYGNDTSAYEQAIDQSYQEIADQFERPEMLTLSVLLSDAADDEELLAEMMADFQAQLADHRQTYQAFLQASSGSDDEQINDLFWQSSDELDSLSFSLNLLIRQIEVIRQEQVQAVSVEVSESLVTFSAAIVITLALSLWAYGLLASYAEPVLALRNAINAIYGSRFRPEILGKLIKQPGPAGDAARALNSLAAQLDAAQAGERQELENARQALYESRRKRLRIHRSEDSQEVQA